MEEQSTLATFGFGSNSVRQLRGRLQDGNLKGHPARVRGQALAFAGPNRSWAHDDDCDSCGTATLVPQADAVALGTVVFLTPEQLSILDGFEGVPHVYDRRYFEGEILQGGHWKKMKVMAYIKVDSSTWHPPSEAYRCAVLKNLSGSFRGLHSLTLRDTSGNVHGVWHHPGFASLSMGAFLFEVGVRKQSPWTLPAAIGPAKAKLRKMGLGEAEALSSALREVEDAQAIHTFTGSPFAEEELEIARQLLFELSRDGESDVEDDCQAARIELDDAVRLQ